MERAVEELAGAVAGEHATGAVGSMGTGSEAHDQQARGRISKRRDGLTPVLPVVPGAAFSDRDGAAVLCEARAPFAGNDLAVKEKKIHNAVRIRLTDKDRYFYNPIFAGKLRFKKALDTIDLGHAMGRKCNIRLLPGFRGL